MKQTTDNTQNAISLLRKRILLLVFLKNSLQGLMGGLFLWGTLIIVCRVFGGVSFAVLEIAGAVILLPIIGAAFYFAWCRVPDEKKLAAAIDCETNGGGLVMTMLELSNNEWAERLTTIKIPGLRWDFRQTAFFLLGGIVFVCVSLLIPENTINAMAGTRKMDVSSRINQIIDRLETLEEEKILDVQKIEELKEEIKRVQQNSEALSPEKTWESIDHLNERIVKEAEKAAEVLLKQTEKMAQAEVLADALQQQKQESESQNAPSKEEMQELASVMQEMLKEASNMNDDPTLEEMQKQIKEQGLDSLTEEQLEQLADKFGEQCGNCQQKLNNLKNSRMIDPERLKDMTKQSREGSQSLKDFLEGQQCQGACQGEGECNGERGGRGGVNEGPGHAALNHDHQTNANAAGFQDQALEAGAIDISESTKLGVTKKAPTPNLNGSAETEGGAVQNTKGVAGSAGRDAVLPKHRGTVKRFFDRQ